jgi:hypothetical protein
MAGRRDRRPRSPQRTVSQDAPLLVPGLKAWFDSRDSQYFQLTGSGVGKWTSRAGSMGAIAWTQSAASNQPQLSGSVSSLAGRQAVAFEGNDFFDTDNTNAWTYLHNGTGAGWFAVLRLDTAGSASQTFLLNNNASTSETGVFQQFTTTNELLRIGNGGGVNYVNNWTNNGSATHYARDVSRWQTWGHVSGTQSSAVSGGRLTNGDVSGQNPTGSNPSRTLRFGAGVTGNNCFQGFVAQLAFFDHPLTETERGTLAAWAQRLYGVQK